MSESIRDVAKKKLKNLSSGRQITLYTTVEGNNYTLTGIDFSYDNRILYFRCNDIKLYESIAKYNLYSGNGLSVTSNLSDTNAYKAFSAVVPKTDKPDQVASDFWENLSDIERKSRGGRRKKSRAKKSRKNRRTRRS
jgi:hypothetical protein